MQCVLLLRSHTCRRRRVVLTGQDVVSLTAAFFLYKRNIISITILKVQIGKKIALTKSVKLKNIIYLYSLTHYQATKSYMYRLCLLAVLH